jgi:serine/threonine protein kinase
MNGSKRQQQLLNQALATPPSDRSAFLDKACGNDESLRREIEMSIVQHQSGAGARSSGGNDAAQQRAKSALIPARLKQALKQDYELQEKLGGGGMCDIYLAKHKSLGGKWAVKVLSESLAKDPKVVERFVTEAKIEANLQHPNIVKVFNIGESGGFHYFVMEFIEGQDLTKRIHARTLAEADTAAIAIQVCNALECAHDNNIVHRDLKPSNVRIDKYGSVYVLDFGIARARDMAHSSTQQSETLGTPLYMSPEQIRGAAVDPRSDLYSLGVMLYEMLTGKNPFEAESTHAVYTRHLNYDPEPPAQINPQVSPLMSDLVCRLLEKDPNRRFQRIGEVTAILKTLDTPAAQRPEGQAAEFHKPPESSPGAAISHPRVSEPRLTSPRLTSPRLTGPRRIRIESTGSSQPVPEALHDSVPPRDRSSSGIPQSGAAFPAEPEVPPAPQVPVQELQAGYFATHQRSIIAYAALLVVIIVIVYVAFRPTTVSNSVAIDAAPFAEITVVDSSGKLVKKGVTPAVLQLSPGKYRIDFEYEGMKQSEILQVEQGKTSHVHEDFWKEQRNEKIETLLDDYLGKQPSHRR